MKVRMAEWTRRAACLGKDVNWWFPEVNSSNRRTAATVAVEHRAKRICAKCPVRRDCLTEAIGFNEEYGIWGGTLPGDRREAAHLPTCRPGTKAFPNLCSGCRPVSEQVDLLLREAIIYALNRGLVATREVDFDEFWGADALRRDAR